jgi:type I restriction enzyme M protein
VDQETRRRLDRITDVLWAGGVTNPVTYIEQISYLIYLKLLDAEETQRAQARQLGVEKPELYPGQASRYRWSEWKFKSGPDLVRFVRDDVFPYMGSLAREEPRIAEYFRDATLEIVDPNVLKQVIDELDRIPFERQGPDEKGDVFEYLLTHLGQSALNGQFRTPRQIRQMMVALVDPDFGDTILDPACGTGGFLIDAVGHILATYSAETRELPIYGEEWLEKRGLTIAQAKVQYPTLQTYGEGPGERLPSWERLERSIYGYDVSRQMLRIAVMNLVLHGIRNAPVKRANTLSELGGLTEEDLRREYTVILSNPPFAGVLPRESIRGDLPTKSKKSELLFLGVMMESLAPGGRCAVVVPEGLLFGSTSAHVDLRRTLLYRYDLQAVVSLPAGVFKPYAGVKTAVLVFRRPARAEVGRRITERVWCHFMADTAPGFDGSGAPAVHDQSAPAVCGQGAPRIDGWRAPQRGGAGALMAGTLLLKRGRSELWPIGERPPWTFTSWCGCCVSRPATATSPICCGSTGAPSPATGGGPRRRATWMGRSPACGSWRSGWPRRRRPSHRRSRSRRSSPTGRRSSPIGRAAWRWPLSAPGCRRCTANPSVTPPSGGWCGA